LRGQRCGDFAVFSILALAVMEDVPMGMFSIWHLLILLIAGLFFCRWRRSGCLVMHARGR